MTDRLISVGILTAALIVTGTVWIALEVTVARWRRRPDTTPFVQSSHVTVRVRGGQR